MKKINITDIIETVSGILGLQVGSNFEISRSGGFRLTCFDAGEVLYYFGQKEWRLEDADDYSIRCIVPLLDELDEVGEFVGSIDFQVDCNCCMDYKNYSNCSFTLKDDE